MLLGPSGCGKSTIWRTLVNTHNWDMDKMSYKTKKTCVYETVNPKAVSGDELYGYMTLSKVRGIQLIEYYTVSCMHCNTIPDIPHCNIHNIP